jgi:hypothetical protein
VTTAANDIDSILTELEQLHARETAALRAMDPSGLDDISNEKEALVARMAGLSGRIGPGHAERLARIRSQASLNQLLLVHARDSVRSILSQVTGVQFETFPGARRPHVVQEGVRLNVRG